MMSTTTTGWINQTMTSLITWPARRVRGPSDRGDVPGWVLITLMTAGLVTLLWGVAGTELENLFREAIGDVAGPSGP